MKITRNQLLLATSVRFRLTRKAKPCRLFACAFFLLLSTFYCTLFTPQASAATLNSSSATLSAGSTFGIASTSASTGLVGHWTFDGKDVINGKVKDQSSFGNDGSPIAIATSTFYTTGKLGQAFKFDGSDDYISIADSTSLRLSNKMTVSGWIRPTTFADYNFVASSNGSDCSIGGWLITTIITTGKLRFQPRVSGSCVDTDSAAALPLNQWTHFTGVYDGTSSLLYINGVLSASVSSSGSMSASTLGLYIGRNRDTTPYTFNGNIDDVRVYNRALSAAEVKQLYLLGGGTQNASSVTLTNGSTLQVASSSASTGLVGHWSFDGKNMSSGSVLDVSGKFATGSPMNIATSTFYTTGKMGQAFQFDGSDDYVNVGDISPFDAAVTSFTISAWIKPNNTGAEKFIAGKMGGAGQRGWQFAIESDATINLDYFDGASGSEQAVATTATVPYAVWTHVVATFSSSSAVDIYINGIVSKHQTSGVLAALNGSNSSSLQIGSRGDNSQLFTGSIDDPRIYNRALSAAEVKQLYLLGGGTQNASSATLANGSTLQVASSSASTGLVGHWSFDGKDVVSGKVKDRSSFGNDGSPLNISTSTFYTIGKMGQALNFSAASSQMVSLPDIDNGIATQLTVSAWIYPTNVAGGYGGIAGTATNGGFMTFTQSSALRCDTVTTSGRVFTATPAVLVNNQWQFITETYDGALMKCYVNGVLLDSTAQTGTITQQSVGRIGYSGSGSEYFQGKIDDVRVYNRALSATEVKQLYLLGK